MSSQKFTIYQCSVCTRQTEIELKADRPDPLRCNITLKCRGLLSRVGDRSSRKFLFTAPVYGLDDFVPRGTTVVAQTANLVQEQASIFSGVNQIAAGCIRRRVTGPLAEFYVINAAGDESILEVGSSNLLLPEINNVSIRLQFFEITPELLQYKKYTYQFTNTVQLILGPDDSPEGKNLRFDAINRLRVYVNGIELDPSHYDRSIKDQVTLTPAITGLNNIVEILVYSDITVLLSSVQLIPFTLRPLNTSSSANLAIRSKNCTGAWRNVIIDGTERLIFFGYDFSLLDKDKSYGIAKIEALTDTLSTPVEVKSSEFQLLLGNEPYAKQDKELHFYLSGSALIDDKAILSYNSSNATGAIELNIDKSNLVETYNQIKFSSEIKNITQTNTVGTTLGINPLRKKYIIGPN